MLLNLFPRILLVASLSGNLGAVVSAQFFTIGLTPPLLFLIELLFLIALIVYGLTDLIKALKGDNSHRFY